MFRACCARSYHARRMKRRTEPTRAITIRVPEPLYIELHAILCNPETGLMRYGTFGRQMEVIIAEWISTQKVHSS